jgi:hypothetical protein
MKYEVQWYYSSINEWFYYSTCWTLRGAMKLACRKLADYNSSSKYRVIDRKTIRVFYTFSRENNDTH